MIAPHFRSAKQLASDIRRRKIGALEALDLFLARVNRFNPRPTRSWPATRRPRGAPARPTPRSARGVWGPCTVPMTVKESYDVVGMPTTWGLSELKDNVPPRNALAVDRLLEAGVVLFGKTNVPSWLADWQSFNPVYGTTNNPWDLSRTPGGSSGGSAAALAAGLTGFEAGSDIGSSIRNPAHYCGVYGHKPTFGIVPPRGQALPGRVAQGDISVIGPMGRSADDLAIGLSVMAGADEIDGAGWRLELPAPRRKTLREFKVAVMRTDPVSEVDDEVQARVQAVAEFLAKKKARVSDTARPAIDTADAHRVYVFLLRAATAGRQSPEEFARNAEIARGLRPDDESYYARMTRANVAPHRDWLTANEARHQMRWRWAEFFRDYDLLLCPAAASVAFPHDHAGERHERTIPVNGRQVPTTDQLWAGYSRGFPSSTVAPAGFSRAGLPIGVQIVGPQYGDRTCIALARLLEHEFQGFVPPPGY
jgi:amidase